MRRVLFPFLFVALFMVVVGTIVAYGTTHRRGAIELEGEVETPEVIPPTT
jgi:hypothetical protein